MVKKESESAPECCDGCVNWERFGKECWVYWELKKDCTMHSIEGNIGSLQ